jgi:hypothetical protein
MWRLGEGLCGWEGERSGHDVFWGNVGTYVAGRCFFGRLTVGDRDTDRWT